MRRSTGSGGTIKDRPNSADTGEMIRKGRRSAGRQGGYLFASAGVLTLLNVFVAPPPGANVGVLVAVSVAALVVAAFALTAPWDRWPERHMLVMVPLALALITVGNKYGGEDPYTYAVYFVVLFVWLGIAQPRWTSARAAPLAAVAYVAPYVNNPDAPAVAISSVMIAVPVCILVGETIASALEKLRRAQASEAARAAALTALVNAGANLQEETDQSRIGDGAVHLALKVLGASGAALVLVDAAGDVLSVFGEGLDLDAATAAAMDALRSDRDGVHDDQSLVVLLPAPGRPLGAMVIEGAPADTSIVRTAQLFAGYVARAVEQLRVVEALTEEVVRDALTGIGNRRHAANALASLHPGDAVVVIDLDRFKEVNDEHGHAAGDAILVAVGEFLTETVRDGDDVARVGGEEFLVVLRQPADAEGAAIRLAEAWRATNPATTFSAGVATHTTARSPQDTMEMADAALYAAKRGGRDRVESADHAAAVQDLRQAVSAQII